MAIVIAALLGAIALPRFGEQRDRAAVSHATRILADAFATARAEAMATSQPVAVRLDGASAAVTVRIGTDTIEYRTLGASHGVSIAATRDSMAYAPGGLGVGAANLTVTLTRGSASGTVTVSRLGRVRW